MQTTTLSFENLHNHGELFANLFRARKESFIVQKKWNLPEAMGMEFDQYDTPQSRWIAIHENGRVLAGIRLTPTTAQCGIYSYMIRDAQRSLLSSIPKDLVDGEAPVAEHVWECSRVFVSNCTPLAERMRVHSTMIDAMVKTARELGATQVLALTAASWPLWTKRCGLETRPLGPRVFIDDGDYQVVCFDLAVKLH
ncbi:acyl-homoserine-lactone synthase [Albirhodobacter sp. R86504]|uniref:acyl-homoserine-lactone synthase n=1 Tax=Albirhodobacter sp. R86504 TaxID=3093848 RepID=UPI00366C1F26